MYSKLIETVQGFQLDSLNNESRIKTLNYLIDIIQSKVDNKQEININFICTHNSRRSHLSQIWAQVASSYFNIHNVNCYSGGTEVSAIFPKIVETLIDQGFKIFKVRKGNNPIYFIKYAENSLPIIGFSKKYDDCFNPQTSFLAIMTCSQADTGCPFIPAAEKRIPITYEDPKMSDNTAEQAKTYSERSLQIATEMFYVFSKINK